MALAFFALIALMTITPISVGAAPAASAGSQKGAKNAAANVPDWAVKSCQNMPGTCSMVNDFPQINAACKGKGKGKAKVLTNVSSKAAINVNGTGTPNPSNQTTGADGGPSDTYVVTLDPSYVATGLCNSAKFMDLLWFASFPVGSGSGTCSGLATYDCFYHDDTVKDFHPAADLSQTPRRQINQCTMSQVQVARHGSKSQRA